MGGERWGAAPSPAKNLRFLDFPLCLSLRDKRRKRSFLLNKPSEKQMVMEGAGNSVPCRGSGRRVDVPQRRKQNAERFYILLWLGGLFAGKIRDAVPARNGHDPADCADGHGAGLRARPAGGHHPHHRPAGEEENRLERRRDPPARAAQAGAAPDERLHSGVSRHADDRAGRRDLLRRAVRGCVHGYDLRGHLHHLHQHRRVYGRNHPRRHRLRR